ncbi:STAS domain-containing protein [Desulfoluna spongiiphila]|uniref:Anti-anti-sigma factor n=1 Tax=Desulfoluna spongiiphila TaxID=419481 RepID=A0A1G5CKM0_9BACT|nr:STAS domain-containing protein [Desulfoluna spongiiphila]SCY03089.1 anti-anti-sigma factor [Desulfoluna spongiiphila]VVS92273.1 stas domain [Desulfoluna spongiiphila]
MSEIIRDENSVTIRPGRDIVASMAGEFRSELNGEIAEDLEELTIDLKGVEMVDSVGIGVIIATHNTLDQHGATLKVINIAEDIYGLFTTMRLDRHFTIEKAGGAS